MPRPYEREYYAPMPSRTTLFLRTCVPWQLLRFVMINLKMIRMISIGHHGHDPRKTTASGPTPRLHPEPQPHGSAGH